MRSRLGPPLRLRSRSSGKTRVLMKSKWWDSRKKSVLFVVMQLSISRSSLPSGSCFVTRSKYCR